MKKLTAELFRGVVKENPTFVLFLGLCPTLALTNNLTNAIGMGISVVVVLALTNSIISMVRKVIPNDIRIPVYITIIASVVTVLGMVMEAYLPELFESLGIYLPLIVVNCIILGRAESFASENTVKDSFIDGAVSGLGFLVGLSILAFARELIGTGQVSLLNLRLIDSVHAPAIFVESSGAFLMFGLIAWMMNTIKDKKEAEIKAAERARKAEIAAKAKAAKEAKEKAEAEKKTVEESDSKIDSPEAKADVKDESPKDESKEAGAKSNDEEVK